MTTHSDDLRQLVDQHFARGLAPNDERRLRDHLPECADCRAAYERYQAAERLDPKAGDPGARLAMGLGLSAKTQRPRRRALRWAVGTWVAVGAAAFVLLVHPPSTTTFTSRGKGIGKPESLEVAVFRLKGERESMRVSDVISPADELAFAYRNEVGKAFLMIFAVEENGHVAWYHPAWTDPADNPKAVPITTQVGFKELPEAVRQALQGTALTVHALFMDKALDVRSVEDRVARGELLADAAAGEVLRTLVFAVRP